MTKSHMDVPDSLYAPDTDPQPNLAVPAVCANYSYGRLFSVNSKAFSSVVAQTVECRPVPNSLGKPIRDDVTETL